MPDSNLTHKIPNIGARLRVLRLAKRKMRLKDLAASSGCSESLLSRVENGLVVPSLQTLHRLCQALGISAAALLDPEPKAAVVSNAGQIDFAASHERDAIAFEHMAVGQRVEGVIVQLPASGKICGPFQHDGEELGYVLEGELELVVNHATTLVKSGASFFFDSSQMHWYRAHGPLGCRAIWITAPPVAYSATLQRAQ